MIRTPAGPGPSTGRDTTIDRPTTPAATRLHAISRPNGQRSPLLPRDITAVARLWIDRARRAYVFRGLTDSLPDREASSGKPEPDHRFR